MIKIGNSPYHECSSKGDKRFSAFYARLYLYNNKSIEEIYQAAKIFEDGSTNLTWKQAKGRKPVNIDYCKSLYSKLWNIYIAENPLLYFELQRFAGLSDMFGKENHCCQAVELWRIRNTENFITIKFIR